MPTYSYLCEGCRKSFSLQMTITKHDKARVTCPKCGTRKVKQRIAGFSAKTSKKS